MLDAICSPVAQMHDCSMSMANSHPLQRHVRVYGFRDCWFRV